jgi:cytochrome P450
MFAVERKEVPKALKRRAPGPRGHGVLGNLPDLRRDRVGFLAGLMRDYGGIVRFRVGTIVAHLVTEPEYVQHVLQTHNKNYDKQTRGFARLRPMLGEGLLTSDGSFWLKQRRIIQPAFHKERIASFAEVMVHAATDTVERWRSPAERGEVVDVAAEMMRLTLRIVAQSLFGAEVDSDAERVGRAVTVTLDWASSAVLKAFVLPQRWPSAANRKLRTAIRTLDEVVLGLIARRRKSGPGERADLLDLLMGVRDEETGEAMNDRQLRDEVMTLFLAGHETTANALSWTFMLLSKHPEVARRLRAELSQELGGRTPSLSDLSKLPYARMVAEESMRLYPPAWSMGRRTIEADEIAGYPIPARSLVLMSPYMTHRNPRCWDNPEGFDPERFSDERVEAMPRFAYFPFGGGPRQCIGNGFAMMELHLLLATLAQHYRLDLLPNANVEMDPSITLRPKGGLPMRLTKV